MQMWQNLIIQLGISGLVVFVAYKIAMKLITGWRESERERNKALAENERVRNTAISDGFKADTEAHQQLVLVMQQIMRWCQRIETKIDTAFDLTPRPQEIMTIPPLTQPKVFVDPALTDDDKTPVEGQRLPVKRAQSEPGRTSTAWGPIKPGHKTSG